ncbi:MAG: tetratricopeptide repeat protein, partial [Candidatus Bipolaricaulia bacterium]
MAEDRRLAAIMFTDIVGYSALAESNEALALDLLERQRELVEGCLDEHDGTLIKSTGDGFLVEFDSALQALNAAMAIQQRLAERNESAPSDRQFQIRIGLHLGDVVAQDGDVFGNGVNVAARIEPLAEPGGICVSRAVHEQVRRQVDARFLTLGPQKLKNLDEPIEVYAVDPSPQQVRQRRLRRTAITAALSIVAIAALVFVTGVYDGFQAALIGGSQQGESPGAAQSEPAPDRALADLPSIAVLPLDNLGPNAENRYFSDGMTEEIITALAQVNGLQVISRTSVFNLNEQELSIPKIAERLQVGYVLDGSVRRAENRVRIAIQLIDVSENTHVWSDTYERKLTDVFEIQKEIARSIADQLQVRLASDETTTLVGRQTDKPEAYEHYLRGRFHWNKRSREGFQRAIEHFQQALEIDPDYARAHAGLADAYSLIASYGHMLPKEAYPKALSAARQALELNTDLAAAHTSLAMVLTNYESKQDLEEAERHFRMALELNPNYATAHHWYSILLEKTDRSTQAFEQAKRAAQLDPLSPIILSNLGRMHAQRGNNERARELYHQALEIDPEFTGARLSLAKLDAEQQNYTAAQSKLKTQVEQRPDDVRTRLNYAQTLMANWQWGQAQQQYVKALDLKASSIWKAQAHLNYSTFLGIIGQLDASIRHIGLAQEYQVPAAFEKRLAVLDLIWRAIHLLYGERDYDRLATMLTEVLRDDAESPLRKATAHIYLAQKQMKAGDKQSAALDHLAKAEDLLNSTGESANTQSFGLKVTLIGTRGLIYAQLGQRDKAQDVLDQLLKRKEQIGLASIVAEIYFQLGETDKGF